MCMIYQKNVHPLLFVALFSVFSTTQAETIERQLGPWVWGISGGVVHQFDVDLADEPGEFNVTRGVLQGSFGYAWDRRNSVSLSVGAGRSSYDFSREATIEWRQPWETIQEYRLAVPIRFAPTKRSDVILIPSVRTYAESGASLSEGRTEGLLAGISWKLSDSLTIGPGFGWFTEIDGGSNAFPILVIDWKITDQLTFRTGKGLAASQGPGLTLDYQLTKKWKLGLTARYERMRFALDGDSPRMGALGEDRSLPLLLVLGYSPCPMTSLNMILGAEFDGKLRLEDASGNRIAQSDFETAPVFGVSFSSKF